MATEEDLKKAHDEEEAADEEAAETASPVESPESPDSSDSAASTELEAPAREKTAEEIEAEVAGKADDAREGSPLQLGYMRFVYATYMAGAMVVAFLVAKTGHAAWYRLGQWKPEFGEPRDEIVYVFSGLVGIAASFYYWRKPTARQYATDVAEELSKVTWPNRKEVTNSTAVVLFYTLFATVFFALLDQFWQYLTDKIYSF